MRVRLAPTPMRPRFGLLLLAALSLGIVSFAEAQQPQKIPRIGYLGIIDEVPERDQQFRQGLRELGYVEGKTIHVERRFAGGKPDRLAGLAAELVQLKVDVIVASGGQAINAARQATRTIPIVFPIAADPVETGFVASLARPGGNVTGLSALNRVLPAKRVELLKEVIPGINRVAVLWNPDSPSSTVNKQETETPAKRLGMRLQILQVRSPDDLDGALRAAIRERAGALIVTGDAVLWSQLTRVVDFSAKNRLPTVFGSREAVQAGGLVSYGTNTSAMFRRSATYVDKILKGAKPEALPVEQPTTFELTINLRTARQLGLTIPKDVLFRADKVIE